MLPWIGQLAWQPVFPLHSFVPFSCTESVLILNSTLPFVFLQSLLLSNTFLRHPLSTGGGGWGMCPPSYTEMGHQGGADSTAKGGEKQKRRTAEQDVPL